MAEWWWIPIGLIVVYVAVRIGAAAYYRTKLEYHRTVMRDIQEKPRDGEEEDRV